MHLEASGTQNFGRVNIGSGWKSEQNLKKTTGTVNDWILAIRQRTYCGEIE